jgi:general secretion pathway protein E
VALKSIGIRPDQVENGYVCRARGCRNCLNTGYRGRMGIFEIMVLDSSLKSLILKTYDSNRIKEEAIRLMNMVTLRQDGRHKVLDGTTTIEEVLRVTQN